MIKRPSSLSPQKPGRVFYLSFGTSFCWHGPIALRCVKNLAVLLFYPSIQYFSLLTRPHCATVCQNLAGLFLYPSLLLSADTAPLRCGVSKPSRLFIYPSILLSAGTATLRYSVSKTWPGCSSILLYFSLLARPHCATVYQNLAGFSSILLYFSLLKWPHCVSVCPLMANWAIS
jgi:hypothetical protein